MALGAPHVPPAEVEVFFNNMQVTQEFAGRFFQGLENCEIIAKPQFYEVYLNSSIPERETVLMLFARVASFLREQKGERHFEAIRHDVQIIHRDVQN